MAALLGLHGPTSRISVTSIAAFAMNANTKIAFDQFCKDLCQIGITEDIIRLKEDEILEILTSQGMVAASSQFCGNDTGDNDQVLEMAYHEYYNDLYRMGFTKDLIPPKAKILEILRSRGVVTSGTNTKEKGQSSCSLLYMPSC